MITKYLTMLVDGSTTSGEVDWPHEPGYERIRALVAPILERGALEHVSVWADFSGGEKYQALDMFVDDCGLIKHLPRNEAATVIYRRANLLGKSVARPVEDAETLSAIYGTAILFNRRVWF